MRYHPCLVSALALSLTACGSKSLPDDLIGKAGTCAVVAASEAREAVKDPEAALPIDQQSRVIHFALLAGASDPKFSSDVANATVKQMQMVTDTMGENAWKKFVEPCKQAFPEADLARDPKLPDDPAKAKLICYALGGFMSRALSAYEETYSDETAKYDGMVDTVTPDVIPAGTKVEDGRKPKIDTGPALAEAAKLGPPSKILATCVQQYPPKEVKLPDQSAPPPPVG